MNIGTTTLTALATASLTALATASLLALATAASPVLAATSPPTTPPADPSPSYDDPANWLCDTDLDATVVEADGTLTSDPFTPAADAPVDCFYAYPTISRDETPISDLTPSPGEEWYVARNQEAPLGTECRVFAPVYRQITLSGLTAVLAGDTTPTPASSATATWSPRGITT